MATPYCIYRTVTPETIVDVITEELNKLDILCERETSDTTSSETYNFYGIKMADSNIRMNFYIDKTSSSVTAKPLIIGMQATGGFVAADNNGTNHTIPYFGSAYSALTMNVFKKSKDFWLINFIIQSSLLYKPIILNKSGFRIGRIQLKDSNGIHVVPVCGIHNTSNGGTYIENDCAFYAFKSINDGKDHIITKNDAIKITGMEFQPAYNVISDWGAVVLPAVAYTTTLTSVNTSTPIPILADEVIGCKSIYGSNIPDLNPIVIDGKTYVRLSDTYHMAVQID